MVGRTVSHYRVLELLANGGMGTVYQAEDLRLGRQVALKFLPADLVRDRHALDRFQREARAASALNHPHICTIYDIDEAEGQPFIAMELLEGKTLRRRILGTRLETDEILGRAQMRSAAQGVKMLRWSEGPRQHGCVYHKRGTCQLGGVRLRRR